MTRYLSLRCDLPAGLEDELAVVLSRFEVLGSSIETTQDGRSSATVYLDAGRSVEADRVRDELAALGVGKIDSRHVEQRDWLEDYRRRVRPFEVGRRWWIDPQPHEGVPTPRSRKRLVIEPSTAFGSGSHESTKLVLMALEQLDVREAAVLDVGTGSGILALAAHALGVREVVALDVDPNAVWVARRVARQQDWRACPMYVAASVESLGDVRFDVILCNMITGEFVPLLPELRRLLVPGGRLVLSGALRSEETLVRTAVAVAGFRMMADRQIGDWWALEVGHA
jgi:ribosomal protein L11 methyltransferase